MTTQVSAMDWTAQSGSGPELYDGFLVPAMFVQFAARLLDEVEVAPGARVLDVACGTGAVCRDAARRAGPGGHVTGVDLGAPMLAVARAHPAQEGSAPITFVEGTAEALPVPDDAFDVATCHHGLQFFGDRGAALRELHRALRPGGRVGIGTWTAIDEQPHFAAIARALGRHVGPEAGEAMRSPFTLADPAVVAGLLEDAGFRGVGARTITLPVRYAAFTDFARLALGAGPLAPVWAEAGAERQAAIAADVRAELAPLADGDDGLASTMTMVLAVATA